METRFPPPDSSTPGEFPKPSLPAQISQMAKLLTTNTPSNPSSEKTITREKPSTSLHNRIAAVAQLLRKEQG